MTQVISVVQEKGGAGKTTLLTAIASLMVEDGAKIAVIDTDPQRHLESWAKKDQTSLDWLYEEDDEKLIPTVKALKKADPAYDAIFVDTAGFKSAMAMHAIAAANLILIPSKANEADAKGAKRTFSHVQSVAEAECAARAQQGECHRSLKQSQKSAGGHSQTSESDSGTTTQRRLESVQMDSF